MKNKILTISIILILLSSIFISSNVFAAETVDLSCCYDVIPLHENGDQYCPYFIYLDNGTYYLVFPQNNSCSNIYLYSVYAKTIKTDNGGIHIYTYNSTNNCFDYLKSKSSNVVEVPDSATFIASNINLYYEREGNCFFTQTPVPLPQKEQTLATVLEETNPMEMWKTLMKNVVVSLVVFLVGLIAFSKAWAWLKTQLSKA